MIGQFVLVRCYSAGVHCGILVSRNGQEVELKDARRIWRWRGANTLNELSQNGASAEYTRISEMVPVIFLNETCEIIPCSTKASENLAQSHWAK
jgi:hypothetical protein